MAILGSFRIMTVTFVGTALLGSLAIGGAVTVYLTATGLNAHLDYDTVNIVPSMQALDKIRGTIGEARIALVKHGIAQSEPELREYDEALAARIAEVDAGLVAYRPLVSDAHEQGEYDQVLSVWNAYKANANPLHQMTLAQKEDIHRIALAGVPAGHAVGEALNVEMAYNADLGKKESDGGAALAAFDKLLAQALIAGALVLVVSVMIVMRNRLSAPLSRLTGAMQDMVGGDLDRDIPGRMLTDEIGDIGRALAAIKDSVAARSSTAAETQMEVQRRVVGALGQGLSALKAGRLNASINQAFPGDYEQLRTDFNEAIVTISDLMREVRNAAQAVSNGANEISAATSDLAARTEGQAASLEESSVAVRELTQSAKSTAQTAALASNLARAAQNSAKGSDETMNLTVEAMNQIAGSSRQMEEIVSLIEGIAFQTNLLALNAGVEAARAGEAGRGFAVVATEVRALAQRSSDAAKDISGIIRSSGRDVEKGVNMIGRTQSALMEIVTSTQELSDMIETIETASRAQSSAIIQIDSAVTDMDRSTQQNAALVEQSSAATRSLSAEAGMMAALVERFELGRDSPKDHLRRAA